MSLNNCTLNTASVPPPLFFSAIWPDLSGKHSSHCPLCSIYQTSPLISQHLPTTCLGFMTPLLVVFTHRLRIPKIPVTPPTHPASPLHPSAHPRWLERGLCCSGDRHTSWSYMEPAGELCLSVALLVNRQAGFSPPSGVSAGLVIAPMEKTL